MPRRTTPQKFRRRLIAIAASAALAPASAWALDLANSPPGTVEPYVAPNVILSLDDSTSMNAKDMIKNTKTRTEAFVSEYWRMQLIQTAHLLLWWLFGMSMVLEPQTLGRSLEQRDGKTRRIGIYLCRI